MEVGDAVVIHCVLEENVNRRFPRAELCRAMRKCAGDRATIREHSGDLNIAPNSGFLVVEAQLDTATEYLSEAQLQKTFLLDGAKGPALYRFLEDHRMPGGFQCEEWFQVNGLETVRHPILRIDVAESLGFERVRRYQTEHYAQYDPGLGLPGLLVRYLSAYHRWRGEAAER